MNRQPLPRPRRSTLYAPGANARALEKTRQMDADVYILDLEDAVAPEAKDQARDQVCAYLRQGKPAGREVVVRVNGLDTPWCAQDIAAVIDLDCDGILLPKIGAAADVERAQALLETAAARPGPALWCMIETPLAILNLTAIAQRMQAGVWVMGNNDLLKDLRAAHTAERTPLLYALGAAVLAARAYGIAILDGVHNDIADLAGLARSCEQARAMGFDGKTLIHPSQVDACNRIFSPEAQAVAQARRIIEAFSLPENAGKGVLQVDGKMVELLHAQMARDTLAIAAAIAARDVADAKTP